MSDHWVTGKEPQGHWTAQAFDELLIEASENQVSDIVVIPNDPLWARIHGQFLRISQKPVSERCYCADNGGY